MKTRVIIYEVGKTFRLYLGLSDQEAERRFEAVRADMSDIERQYEKDKGWTVKRTVIEDTDEVEICVDFGEEMNDMAQMMLQRLMNSTRKDVS